MVIITKNAFRWPPPAIAPQKPPQGLNLASLSIVPLYSGQYFLNGPSLLWSSHQVTWGIFGFAALRLSLPISALLIFSFSWVLDLCPVWKLFLLTRFLLFVFYRHFPLFIPSLPQRTSCTPNNIPASASQNNWMDTSGNPWQTRTKKKIIKDTFQVCLKRDFFVTFPPRFLFSLM